MFPNLGSPPPRRKAPDPRQPDLVRHWQTQTTLCSCSAASVAVILRRALERAGKPFRGISDLDMLAKVGDPDWSARCTDTGAGVSLPFLPGKIASAYAAYGLPVPKMSGTHIGGPTPAEIEALRDACRGIATGTQVIVDFDQRVLFNDPEGEGHWSPIAAYDPLTDRVLMVDVAEDDIHAAKKWIKLTDLARACTVLDDETQKPGGFVRID